MTKPLLFALMAPLLFIEGGDRFFGPPGAILGPICLLAVVTGWELINGRIWRNPACDDDLGRAFNPRHCRRCGIELRR